MGQDSIDKKIESARHDELIKAIKAIPSLLPKTDNSQIAKAIENNTKEIGSFGKALADLEVKVEAPVVNVKTDLSELSKEIKEMKECQVRIEKLLIEQNTYFKEMARPKDYDFEIKRDRWGVIQSPVKAKVKN